MTEKQMQDQINKIISEWRNDPNAEPLDIEIDGQQIRYVKELQNKKIA